MSREMPFSTALRLVALMAISHGLALVGLLLATGLLV